MRSRTERVVHCAAMAKAPKRRTGSKPAAKKASPKKASPKKAKPPSRTSTARKAKPSDGPVLLSGGNPQIPKGDGDGPVRAYIAAVPPGWKRDTVARLDGLIAGAVPGVRRAVKWNSPFYGAPGEPRERGWFACLHCFTRFVRVTFMNGEALEPLPPGPSKVPKVRYLDVYQDGPGVLDESQFVQWVKQASVAPGEWM